MLKIAPTKLEKLVLFCLVIAAKSLNFFLYLQCFKHFGLKMKFLMLIFF